MCDYIDPHHPQPSPSHSYWAPSFPAVPLLLSVLSIVCMSCASDHGFCVFMITKSASVKQSFTEPVVIELLVHILNIMQCYFVMVSFCFVVVVIVVWGGCFLVCLVGWFFQARFLCVATTGLKFRDPHACASQALRLKACTPTNPTGKRNADGNTF